MGIEADGGRTRAYRPGRFDGQPWLLSMNHPVTIRTNKGQVLKLRLAVLDQRCQGLRVMRFNEAATPFSIALHENDELPALRPRLYWTGARWEESGLERICWR